MGVVFLAHDERLERQVAIKRMHSDNEVPPERRDRFRREARITAKLNHPAIVQIYDVVSTDEGDCIVMEYVEGSNLRHRLSGGLFSIANVLILAHQIALGMAEAHDQGIVHRDLKPENILITSAGQVKITDFGIAKIHGEDALTDDGAVIGTYRSMSPEQALGRVVDHRSDLFSFGILLYEALAGVSPFHADTPFLTLQRIVHGQPIPLVQAMTSVPQPLAELVDQLLHKDPNLRPRDFHEVGAVLLELMSDHCDKPCGGTGGLSPASPDQDQTVVPGQSHPGDLNGAITEEPSATKHRGAATRLARLRRLITVATGRDSGSHAQPNHSASARASGPNARRWRRYLGAAVLAAAALIAAAMAYLNWRAQPSPVRVAVLPAQFNAPGAASDEPLLVEAIRVALADGVRARPGLILLPLADIDRLTEGAQALPVLSELAALAGADEVISTSITCAPANCSVRLGRVTASGREIATRSFELAIDEVGYSRQSVVVHLNLLYADHPVDPESNPNTMSEADYNHYVQLRQEYWSDDSPLADPSSLRAYIDRLLGQLSAIRQRAPGYLPVYLFEIEVLRHRYAQHRNRADLEHALALIEQATERTPDAYELKVRQFQWAMQAGNTALAEDALAALERQQPGSGVTVAMRARLTGDKTQARALLRTAAERDPSWRILYRLAKVERDLGDLGAARTSLRTLLKRSPGNYAGQSLLASVEAAQGQLECARKRFQALVARRPYYDECLNLGVMQVMLQRYQDAHDNTKCALAMRPNDLAATYNLALVEKLLERDDDALAQFEEILRRVRGQAQPCQEPNLMVETLIVAHLAHLAPERTLWRDQAQDCTAKLEAQSPSQSEFDFAYLMATAYALLGKHDQAGSYVEAALAAHPKPDWFHFAWFDNVRALPGPRSALARRPEQRCD